MLNEKKSPETVWGKIALELTKNTFSTVKADPFFAICVRWDQRSGSLMRGKLFLKCLKKHSRAVFEFFCLARLRLNTSKLFSFTAYNYIHRLCYDLRSLRIFARSICVTNASRACGQRWTRADWPFHIIRDLSGTTDNNRVMQSAEACNSIVDDNAHMIQKIFEINNQTTRTQLKVIKEVLLTLLSKQIAKHHSCTGIWSS